MPYYAVYKGFKPGIYTNWSECQNQTQGFPKPVFRKFTFKSQAEEFMNTGGIYNHRKHNIKKKKNQNKTIDSFFNVLPEKNLKDMFDMSHSIVQSMNSQTTNPIEHLSKDIIYVYTDGGCYGNGKKISFAGSGIYFDKDDPRNTALPITKGTNNIAELCAINKAIEILQSDIEKKKNIVIISDSKYSIRCFTDWGDKCHKRNWKHATHPKGRIPNMQFFREAYYYLKKYPNVKFHHVYSHTHAQDIHSLGNEQADILANDGIKLDIDTSDIDTLSKVPFPFGQYKGKKIMEVFLLDKQYILWAYKNCKSNMLIFKHILYTFLTKMNTQDIL
jgi:ribonuclease HI